MGFIATAPNRHFIMYPEPLPPAVFESTRQGFIAAYRQDLLRENGWRNDDRQLAAILTNAERTLRSHRVFWRHDTAEAERAFRLVSREPSKVSLERLRALPEGAAYNTYEIALNVIHGNTSSGFNDWLEGHGHAVVVLMRHNRPSLLNGREVRIGHRPLRERSEEERIIDFLYSLFLNETRRPAGELQQ